jgi:hypothetical protein
MIVGARINLGRVTVALPGYTPSDFQKVCGLYPSMKEVSKPCVELRMRRHSSLWL